MDAWDCHVRKGTASEPVLSEVEWMPKSASFFRVRFLDCFAIKEAEVCPGLIK
jgi:hypothetical protein